MSKIQILMSQLFQGHTICEKSKQGLIEFVQVIAPFETMGCSSGKGFYNLYSPPQHSRGKPKMLCNQYLSIYTVSVFFVKKNQNLLQLKLSRIIKIGLKHFDPFMLEKVWKGNCNSKRNTNLLLHSSYEPCRVKILWSQLIMVFHKAE